MASRPELLDPAFQAQFLRIRQAFIGRLPERMRHIREAASAEDRYVELHRLAGAAGGYGLDHLGVLAREAMQAAEAAESQILERALQQLEEAIRLATTATG